MEANSLFNGKHNRWHKVQRALPPQTFFQGCRPFYC
jgi:hypothetical protein